MPMVTVEIRVSWIGVDVLHQEQVRRALDVGDDAPSFRNDVGQV
jgi:hypothetical protein